MLRPGNAAANSIDTGIAAVRLGDDPWACAVPNPQQAREPNKAKIAQRRPCGFPDDLGRTRLIVRRGSRRPGGQRSLFASRYYRYGGFLTDVAGSPTHAGRLMY